MHNNNYNLRYVYLRYIADSPIQVDDAGMSTVNASLPSLTLPTFTLCAHPTPCTNKCMYMYNYITMDFFFRLNNASCIVRAPYKCSKCNKCDMYITIGHNYCVSPVYLFYGATNPIEAVVNQWRETDCIILQLYHTVINEPSSLGINGGCIIE